MATAPFFRTPFNYDRNAVSDETGLKCLDKSRTQQSMAEQADINVIVERFGLTGELPVGLRAPSYQDFEGIFDFHSAMEAVTEANQEFMSMPAKLRARFHNSPQEFMEFFNDESNREEAVRLGLVIPPKAPVEAPGSPGAGAKAPLEAGAAPAPADAPKAPVKGP